jgi:hypothetical protein
VSLGANTTPGHESEVELLASAAVFSHGVNIALRRYKSNRLHTQIQKNFFVDKR